MAKGHQTFAILFLVDPFANYKSKIKTVDRVFLSEDELQRMADKKLRLTV